jgi:protein O-GlcNAc transferase
MNRRERRRRQKEQGGAQSFAPQVFDPAKLSKALKLHQGGQLSQAKSLYLEMLKQNPENSQVLHFLGLVYHQEEDQNRAVELIERAIFLNPDAPEFHNNLGSVYQAKGMHLQAMTAFQAAISLKPDYAVAYNNLGSALRDLGRLREAVEALEHCLSLDSTYGSAYNTLGTIRIQEGQQEDALELFSKALEIAPSAQAAFNLGNLHQNAGRGEEAESCYLKALEIAPNDLQVLNNLASLLRSRGLPKESEIYFRKILDLNPCFPSALLGLGTLAHEAGRLQEAHDFLTVAVDQRPKFPEAWNNLGNVFKDWGNLDQAITCFKRALSYHPGFSGASFNLGIAYKKNSKIQEAIGCFREALKGDPEMAEAHYFLGNALKDLGQTQEAMDFYRQALVLRPEFSDARASLLHEFRNLCNWDLCFEAGRELDGNSAKEILAGKKTGEQPHLNVTRCDDAKRNLDVARSWSLDLSSRMQDLASSLSFKPRHRQSKSRIRLGYLSNDFHNHPCAHLYKELFGLHNRENFEVFLYSHGVNDASVYRQRSERDADHFVEVQCLGDAEAAQKIYEDEIDILVDLQGFTRGNRLEILALCPAPIQVSWLGFPGTTGANFIDYILTDRIVTPPQVQEFYSEKFVYLPHCYQITDANQDVSPQSVSRADFNLPQQGFIFSSFNQNYKLEPLLFEAWTEILKACDSSVLWLLNSNPKVVENLRLQASNRGIDPDRLVFSDVLPKPEHLARLSLSDLVLDTRICNGHTTTSDALFAGVPVLTLKGKHFSSRVSASILTAIGLEDLITTTLDDYVSLAIILAKQANGTQELKTRLETNRSSKPLFDTPQFVKDLEDCYRKMMK